MNIWLLCTKKAKTTLDSYYGIPRFIEEAPKCDVNLQIFCPEDFELIITSDGTHSLHVEGKPVEALPDCVIPRMTGTTYFYFAVMRHLERLGVYCLNGSDGLELAKDKLASLQVLASSNIAIPKTLLAKFPLDEEFVSTEFKFPVVLKKLSGSEGKGIVLCRSKVQLKDTIELADPNSNLIIQEYIKSSHGKDIRVLVVGGRAVGAMGRIAAKGKFKANHSLGGTVAPIELTPEMEWLAVESANKIGLDMAGVDLLYGKDGLLLCEVNGCPGFKGFELATKLNIPKICYDYLHIRLNT
jgi:gamma-F420-2:alpha-L-glutamate ligase